MKLSDIENGMVVEVLTEGVTERFLVIEVFGERILENKEYGLGELDYYFNEDLSSKHLESITKIFKFKDSAYGYNYINSLMDDSRLETIYNV